MTVPTRSGQPRPTAAGHRRLMSAFPTGVAVVTAFDEAGAPHGLTCTSLASVAVEPCTLLVCLDVRSGTYAAVRSAGRFTVNLLRASGRNVAELFSSAEPDRFARVTWQVSPVAAAPWLTADAFAMADCEVTTVVPVADHAVVVGEVLHLSYERQDVLIYGMRRYGEWLAHPEDPG